MGIGDLRRCTADIIITHIPARFRETSKYPILALSK